MTRDELRRTAIEQALKKHQDQPVRETLIAKCADCHSMQTNAPLYGRFAPVSWLMERDIVEARQYAQRVKAWAELDPSCKRRRGKHDPRVR